MSASVGRQLREGREIFDPWERLFIISLALDELPDEPWVDAMRAIATACFTVVRQQQGKRTSKEAYEAVRRAHEAVRALRVRSKEEPS